MLDQLLARQTATCAHEGHLSASVLQEAIHLVDVRQEEVLVTLFAGVAERYASPSEDWPPPAEEAAHCETLASIPPGADAALGDLVAQAQALAGLCCTTHAVQSRLEALRAAAAAASRLADFDAARSAARLEAAADLALGFDAGSDFLDEAMLRTLRARRQDLHLHLLREAAAAAAEPGAAGSGVWAALRTLGLVPEAVRGAAAAFAEARIPAALGEGLAAGTSAGEGPPSGPVRRSARLLSPAPSSTSSCASGLGAGPSVERALYSALKTLCRETMEGDAELVAALGESLWPQLAEAYIQACLRPLLPTPDCAEAEDLASFGRAAGRGSKLEAKARTLGLLGPDTASEGPIAAYIREAMAQYALSSRARLVEASAACLASWDSRDTRLVSLARPGSEDGAPPPADQPSLLVSAATARLLALARAALASACEAGSPVVAQAVAAGVVEVAALIAEFRPLEGADQLLLPWPAALRHNDCQAAYQLLAGLPHDLAPRLQALVHRAVNFANPGARVRRAGSDALAAMLAAQRAELGALAADAGVGVGGGLDGAGGLAARRGAAQLLAGFRRLGVTLREALDLSVRLEVVAVLVNAVCDQLLEAILGARDISVDESERLPRLFREFTDGVLDAGLGLGRKAREDADVSAREALQHATPSLAKLKEVLELVEIRLTEIAARWEDGRLSALGLAPQEVAHLVRALFEDTPARRALLTALGKAR
ncbi:hypothetical protein ACKKBF_B18925 [Auxenochlorella protothecoides x Auxenochlorella symbiontica]